MNKTQELTIEKLGKRKTFLLKVFSQRSLALLIIIIFLIIIFSLLLPNFFSLSNLKYTLLALSDKGICAIGTTLLLVSGSVDLSVGSIFAFAGALTALLMVNGVPVWISVIIGILAGSFIGLVNGLIVQKLKVNFLIATLGTLGIVRGFAILIAQQPIAFLPKEFNKIGQMVIFGFQSPVWIMFVILIVVGLLLAKHRYFRQYYYIGGNEKAAIFSGIRVPSLRIISFVIAGLIAGISGIVYTARAGAATATMGMGMELKVIAGAVIGGCSLSGGEGSIFGTFLGVILMELILDILVFAKVTTYWHDIVTGIILILAVAFDQWIRQRSVEARLS
jgi:ribose transport system permease protein